MVYLQASCDNGSKIQNYILQWDEVIFLFIMKEMLNTAQHSCFTLCRTEILSYLALKTKDFVL